MERKLFVIGERDAVLGFALAGVPGYTTADPDDARRKIDELRRDPEMGVIMITSALAGRLGASLGEDEGDLPLIYEIPGPEGMEAPGSLREALLRALGVRV